MSIGSLNDYIGSVKQVIPYSRTTARTSVANVWFNVFDLAGNPGAGTLAGTSTAAGVVPTDATAGCPIIGFSTGSGYLATVDFSNTVACRLMIYDMLFKAGAYAFNANTALSSQPSFSSRIPGGTDYTGLQIWVEAVTAGTLVQNVTVTYMDQDGNTGASTGAVASSAALTVGKMFQLPLASGDSGVQKIENVQGTVASAGTFNVLVLRPLWSGRVAVANAGDCHALDRTGLPQVWTDSALGLMVAADSTSTGLPDCMFEIASN